MRKAGAPAESAMVPGASFLEDLLAKIAFNIRRHPYRSGSGWVYTETGSWPWTSARSSEKSAPTSAAVSRTAWSSLRRTTARNCPSTGASNTHTRCGRNCCMCLLSFGAQASTPGRDRPRSPWWISRRGAGLARPRLRALDPVRMKRRCSVSISRWTSLRTRGTRCTSSRADDPVIVPRRNQLAQPDSGVESAGRGKARGRADPPGRALFGNRSDVGRDAFVNVRWADSRTQALVLPVPRGPNRKKL